MAPRIDRATRAQAIAERRALEREPLRAFLERVQGAAIPPHLNEYVAALEEGFARQDAGETTRLLVLAAPGLAKSTTITRALAWRFGKRPRQRVIYTSYAEKLARHHARELRDVGEQYAGVQVDSDARSAGEWYTSSGGYCLAAGLGGTSTGFRADVAVTDDYCSGRTNAESEAHRQAAIDAHKTVTRTRLDLGGFSIIVAAPWHPRDLSAHAITNGYRVVRIPALGPDGESVWPSQRPTKELREIEEELGPRDWQSLYMLEPSVVASALFEDVHEIDLKDVPPRLHIGIGIDCAYGERKGADWTVAVVLGKDRSTSRCFVLDVLRSQDRIEAFAPKLRRLVDRWQPRAGIRWDVGGQERAIARLLERVAGVEITVKVARVDKVQRATPVSIAWNRGRVFLVKADWNDAFMRVVSAFGPGARRDDDVDALASAYAALSSAGHMKPFKVRWETY